MVDSNPKPQQHNEEEPPMPPEFVERGGGRWAYKELHDIARHHYVVARVCLQNLLVETGCLLAQQSIEAYIKAIALATNEKGAQLYNVTKDENATKEGQQWIWGHKLLELTEKITSNTPDLNAILRDKEMRQFLERMTEAYASMRYAQANYVMANTTEARLLDSTVSILDRTYNGIINLGAYTLLLVPECFRDSFLDGNEAFPARKTTNTLLVSKRFVVPVEENPN